MPSEPRRCPRDGVHVWGLFVSCMRDKGWVQRPASEVRDGSSAWGRPGTLLGIDGRWSMRGWSGEQRRNGTSGGHRQGAEVEVGDQRQGTESERGGERGKRMASMVAQRLQSPVAAHGGGERPVAMGKEIEGR
ncbi:hypothetical protein E2562_018494 [Oryza meyeriana var. granulata]|uniref:Uncharacterized protein n=1 Tax=Oryza meyeriana var. granulata TaxID=110450 RepID=A0A6G1EMN3_9ORYZ|nr:hypothetical protein E2562_018494 [Oryza meyeriana var. granulata]